MTSPPLDVDKVLKEFSGEVPLFPLPSLVLFPDTIVPLLLSLIDGQKEPAFVYVNHRVVSPQNIKLIYPNACK